MTDEKKKMSPDEEIPMSPKNETKKSARSAGAKGKQSEGFTAEEKAAMKERTKELKAEAKKASGEGDLLAKIAEMAEPDRSRAERLHELVKSSAPSLSPKT